MSKPEYEYRLQGTRLNPIKQARPRGEKSGSFKSKLLKNDVPSAWCGNPELEYQLRSRITTFSLLPLLSCLNSFCSPLTTSISAILLSHPIFRNLSCLEKGNLSCLSRKVLKTGKSVLYIKYSEQCPCPQPLEETPLSPHEECWINPVLLLWVPLPVSFCSRSFYNKPKHTDSKP